MHRLTFWNRAIDLLDALASLESGQCELTLPELLSTFAEAHHGLFEPETDFEAYVLVAIINKTSRVLAHTETEG